MESVAEGGDLTRCRLRGDLNATSTPATVPQVRPAEAMPPTMTTRPTLTAAALAARGMPLRTAQYRLARWRALGWPRVYQVPRAGRVGGVAWVVDAGDYEALVRGDPPEIAKAA